MIMGFVRLLPRSVLLGLVSVLQRPIRSRAKP
jgi:hypothetical protein